MTREILEEVVRRFGSSVEAQESSASVLERVLATRFDKQVALIRSPARRRAALCPRRSGKTEANVGLLLDGALSGAGHIVLFVAKTRQRARELTWAPVEAACGLFGLETAANESTLTRRFPNGSEIRWLGADNLRALKSKRGDKLWRVVIDEAQDYDFAVLRQLSEAIFGPALEDLSGDIILTGTPGEVCAGAWYAITGDDPDELKRIAGWQRHVWTPLDNPHVPSIHAQFASGELAKKYGGEDSPTYQREWLGKWVRDTGALFYRFSADRNIHNLEASGDGWSHVLGLDVGLRDDMAIVAWGFNDKHRGLFEAYSWKKSGALMDEVVAQIRGLETRLNIIAKVVDTGGAGALWAAEVAKRHGMLFEPAKKVEKAQHVRLFNDELQKGDIKLRSGSPYEGEIAVLPKVLEWDEEKTGKPAPEDPRFANHCADAGLYAWRWAYHYLGEAETKRPQRGTPEAYAEEERQMEERMFSTLRRQSDPEYAWWEQ